jgi:hypothetical protein
MTSRRQGRQARPVPTKGYPYSLNHGLNMLAGAAGAAEEEQAARERTAARRAAAWRASAQRQQISQLVGKGATIYPGPGATPNINRTPASNLSRGTPAYSPVERGACRPGGGKPPSPASMAAAAEAAAAPPPPWFQAYMRSTLVISKRNAPQLREEYIDCTRQLQAGASMSDPIFARKMGAAKAILKMAEDRIADMETLLGLPLSERTCMET